MQQRSTIALASLGAFALLGASAHAAPVYSFIDISSFANNNIYTDLNENFPNTGAGTPGSHTGAANATFLFTPWTYTPPAAAASGVAYSSYAAPLGNNGVSFRLNSNASGQDFAQIGNPGGGAYTGPNPITVPIGAGNATTVYALMASYTGQSFSVQFNGTAGSQSFTNVFVPDFNGGSVNSCGGGLCRQTVYQVTDVGGGGTGNSTTGNSGTYDLTELAFTLDPSFSSSTLTSATFTSNGYETLLFGLTVETVPAPEPGSLALLCAGLAGLGWSRRSRPA